MDVITRFCEFYRQLEPSSAEQLGQLYATSVHFIDPVTERKSLPSLREYFEELLQNVTECTFDIQHHWSQSNHAFFQWQMKLQHQKLNAGKPFLVDGFSHIIIEQDYIIYHRDYYDLGQMMYEKLPVFGKVFQWMKTRMTQ